MAIPLEEATALVEELSTVIMNNRPTLSSFFSALNDGVEAVSSGNPYDSGVFS